MNAIWTEVATGKGSAARNMAFDEALLRWVSRWGHPVLRFYGWSERAASFGYFQRHTDVELLTPLRPLIRRPTGGGLVLHDGDWTYTLAFPVGHPWYRLRARDSYRRLHQWLQAAFARLGLETELAPAAVDEGPGKCFVGAEMHDLVCGDAKIAGAAQRRTKTGLLIQGSVRAPENGPDLAAWREALQETASESWGVEWTSADLPAEFVELVEELERNTFARRSHNHKR